MPVTVFFTVPGNAPCDPVAILIFRGWFATSCARTQQLSLMSALREP